MDDIDCFAVGFLEDFVGIHDVLGGVDFHSGFQHVGDAQRCANISNLACNFSDILVHFSLNL